MTHQLPELPFPKNALEPFMSAETLEYHHGKHHRAYVDKLNKLIVGTEFENAHLEDIILRSNGAIFNNAAQIWNHTFFWNCLTPQQQEVPTQLKAAIEKQFGSMDSFKEQFIQAAIGQFGSGWAWLVRKGSTQTLAIVTTSNAETPLRTGDIPLFTCDVWEHAYYIDYRNDRSKFTEAFWKLLNWEFAARNFVNGAVKAA